MLELQDKPTLAIRKGIRLPELRFVVHIGDHVRARNCLVRHRHGQPLHLIQGTCTTYFSSAGVVLGFRLRTY